MARRRGFLDGQQIGALREAVENVRCDSGCGYGRTSRSGERLGLARAMRTVVRGGGAAVKSESCPKLFSPPILTVIRGSGTGRRVPVFTFEIAYRRDQDESRSLCKTTGIACAPVEYRLPCRAGLPSSGRKTIANVTSQPSTFEITRASNAREAYRAD
jgi:hypothetical protein